MAGQLTLAMIKPHAVLERKVGKIITRIEKANFGIVLAKMIQIHKEGAEEFYKEHAGEDFFDKLTSAASESATWALVLAKPNAVQEWRDLIGVRKSKGAGVGTIRNEFGSHINITNNAVHGSATDHDAKREINFFFAREIKIAARLDLDKEHLRL